MVRLGGSCEGMQDRENQSPSVQNVFCSAFKENSYQQETKANMPESKTESGLITPRATTQAFHPAPFLLFCTFTLGITISLEKN